MAEPINQKNSIESSSFILVFERGFTKQELLSLNRLESQFHEDLPSFKQLSSISVKLIGGATAEQSQHISGVVLQCFKNNGKPSWELTVENNTIEVSCFDYDNWVAVWGKVECYLLETIKSIEDNNNKLLICALKTIDKYLSEIDSYRVGDVFSPTTPYLPQIVLNESQGSLWHVFQGWFEQSDNNAYLNNLNLITSNENGKITTTIDHVSQCQFIKTPQLIAEFKKTELADTFAKLHEKNKAVLRQLLNDKQLERIGL